MWVIVGLGNPGAEYAQTRHNVGFMVVEAIARRWSIALERCDAALRIGRGAIAGHPVLLAEPQMYMNCSGEALSQCPRDADDEVAASGRTCDGEGERLTRMSAEVLNVRDGGVGRDPLARP